MINLGRSSLSHSGQYLGPTIECDFVEWMIWVLKWKVKEPILTQENQLWVRESVLVESKSKNWNSHSFPINGMWLSKIGDSISRSIGTGINVGSENWSKFGKNIGVNIDSKMGTE